MKETMRPVSQMAVLTGFSLYSAFFLYVMLEDLCKPLFYFKQNNIKTNKQNLSLD